MIVDKNVRCEALSALLGTKITALDDVTDLHGVTTLHGGLALQGRTAFQGVTDLRGRTALHGVTALHGGLALQGRTAFQGVTDLLGVNPRIAVPTLTVDGFFHKVISCNGNDGKDVKYNGNNEKNFKYDDNAEEFFINEKEFFDPGYDFDFTNLSDSAACMRGNEPYVRPNGWYRMVLKVKGKYPDGDTWLGPCGWRSYSVPGEWPVSYHGTGLDGEKGIVRSHYKVGGGQAYGRGIYSTPNLSVAERYSKEFTSESTGKTYKVIMQNRINPEKRQICRPGYWLIPVSDDESDEEEKSITESSIRPYGVLIKEI